MTAWTRLVLVAAMLLLFIWTMYLPSPDPHRRYEGSRTPPSNIMHARMQTPPTSTPPQHNQHVDIASGQYPSVVLPQHGIQPSDGQSRPTATIHSDTEEASRGSNDDNHDGDDDGHSDNDTAALPPRYWQNNNMLQDGLYPRLIGIGVQKSGSASLFVYLSSIVGFLPPIVKEVHGFRGNRIRLAGLEGVSEKSRNEMRESLEWYGDKWWKHNLSMSCDVDTGRCHGTAKSDQVPFEITPRYLSDFKVPYNMMALLPHATQVKLVLIIRDPIERLWSSFFQSTNAGMHNETFFQLLIKEEVRILRHCYNQTLGKMSFGLGNKHFSLQHCRNPWVIYQELAECTTASNPDPMNRPWFLKYTMAYRKAPRKFRMTEQTPYEGLVVRGIYVDQLFNYLCAGFAPDQILILTNGELRDNPMAAIGRVTQHVNSPFNSNRMKLFESGIEKQGRSRGRGMAPEVLTQLQEFYKPHNQLLIRLIASRPFRAQLSAIATELDLT